jgi:CheY-like chemotaxis protein
MDQRLPGASGTDALIAIRKESPRAIAMMVIISKQDMDVRHALNAGLQPMFLRTKIDLDEVMRPGGNENDGSCERGRRDSLHRLLSALGEDGVVGDGPLQLRHCAFPGKLCALHAGELRPADSETRTRKGHGHPGIEGDGKDGMICRPEAEPSQAKMLISACSFH